jgi:methyl-accepting chemotaxis protein
MPKRNAFTPKRGQFPIARRNGFKANAQMVSGAITDAAERADRIGQRVSRVANSVQQVSETASEATKKA